MFHRAASALPVWAWALLIALLPIALRMVDQFGAMPPGSGMLLGTHDPDSWLRLTLVRQWMEGGSWYDHSYASNVPLIRPVSPWTRPLDLVIATLTHLQWGSAPLTIKLLRTSFFLPLVWMALLAGALLYTMRRLTAMPHALLMLAVLLVSAPINYNYFGPANADHHAPLSAIFGWVVALTVTADHKRWHTSLLTGLLLALTLWISPEGLILIAIIYGWYGLEWLAGGSVRPLARLATITALGAAAAIMIERPFADWDMALYDTISISHVVPLALVAIGCWLLTRITGFYWLWRALAAALVLAVAAGIVEYLDPLFFHGPMATVDDFIRTDFLPRIIEAKHSFKDPTLKFIGLMIQPLLALYVAARCAFKRDGVISQRHAAMLLYLLVITLGLYTAQIRWSYYFFPYVALILAPWLGSWLNPHHRTIDSYWPAKKLRRFTDNQMLMRRLPLLAIVLGLPILLISISEMKEKKIDPGRADCTADTRELIQNGELDRLGGRALNLFISTDVGGETLFFTRHRIIASNYHREGPGIEDVWDAQATESLDDVHRLVARRKIDALLICPDKTGPGDTSVLTRLRLGKTKAPWLTPYKIKTEDLSDTPPAIFLVKAPGR